MSRTDAELLDDIAEAISAIHSHLEHGPISVKIVMDAVAMRLLEIGESVKALGPFARSLAVRGLTLEQRLVAQRRISA